MIAKDCINVDFEGGNRTIFADAMGKFHAATDSEMCNVRIINYSNSIKPYLLIQFQNWLKERGFNPEDYDARNPILEDSE